MNPDEIYEKALLDDGDIKADQGKDRWDLIPIEPLIGVAKIFAYGAEKYNDNNWKQSKYPDRYYAACMRHLAEVRRGNLLDKESRLPHIDHALVCLMMYRELNNLRETAKKQKNE